MNIGAATSLIIQALAQGFEANPSALKKMGYQRHLAQK